MARTSNEELMAKLSDLSEGAIQRFSDTPGADRLLGALNATRERLDDLQRRIRGIDELEKRLTVLERKVDKLSKAQSSRAKAAPKETAKSD